MNRWHGSLITCRWVARRWVWSWRVLLEYRRITSETLAPWQSKQFGWFSIRFASRGMTKSIMAPVIVIISNIKKVNFLIRLWRILIILILRLLRIMLSLTTTLIVKRKSIKTKFYHDRSTQNQKVFRIFSSLTYKPLRVLSDKVWRTWTVEFLWFPLRNYSKDVLQMRLLFSVFKAIKYATLLISTFSTINCVSRLSMLRIRLTWLKNT